MSLQRKMKVEVSDRNRERKPMNNFTDTESSGKEDV